MKTRIISGAVLVALGLAVLIPGGAFLLAALLFCSVVGMEEYYKATGVTGGEDSPTAIIYTAYAGCAFYYIAMFFRGSEWCLPAAALVEILILACYVLLFPKISSSQAVNAAFGFIYVAVMLGFIYLIREGESGERVVYLVFLSSWIADTCAYFTGRFLGKHKLAPVLSPKKTKEGAAGGIIGSAVSGAVFAALTGETGYIWQFAVICGVGAVISMFGDLAASAIKRDHGIKDYGHLIPGHGGILDRFDSVIFTAPVIYFLSLILIGRGL